jgi:hypothetical protein
MTMRQKTWSFGQWLAGGAFASLAVAGMALSLAVYDATPAGEEVKRQAKIKIMTPGGGGLEEFDVSDLAVGDSRTFTTAEGKEVDLTRLEEGFSITVDGKEIVAGGGEGAQQQVFVHRVAHGDGEDVNTMVFTGSGSGEGAVWEGAADAGPMVFAFGEPGNQVVISGAGNLDADARERIEQALKDVGVDKKVVFAPGGGPHVMRMRTNACAGTDCAGCPDGKCENCTPEQCLQAHVQALHCKHAPGETCAHATAGARTIIIETEEESSSEE